jgi:hypothetical protein
VAIYVYSTKLRHEDVIFSPYWLDPGSIRDVTFFGDNLETICTESPSCASVKLYLYTPYEIQSTLPCTCKYLPVAIGINGTNRDIPDKSHDKSIPSTKTIVILPEKSRCRKTEIIACSENARTVRSIVIHPEHALAVN